MNQNFRFFNHTFSAPSDHVFRATPTEAELEQTLAGLRNLTERMSEEDSLLTLQRAEEVIRGSLPPYKRGENGS